MKRTGIECLQRFFIGSLFKLQWLPEQKWSVNLFRNFSIDIQILFYDKNVSRKTWKAPSNNSALFDNIIYYMLTCKKVFTLSEINLEVLRDNWDTMWHLYWFIPNFFQHMKYLGWKNFRKRVDLRKKILFPLISKTYFFPLFSKVTFLLLNILWNCFGEIVEHLLYFWYWIFLYFHLLIK